jgi:hypothetical protein
MLLSSASALNRACGGVPGAPEESLINMKTQQVETPMPAATRRGGRWGLHALCIHLYEGPPGTPKAEALLSNIV